MISKIKRSLYFPLAQYFRFFAKIALFLWKPRIIVITGSNGKTTLLHLIQSQLGERAKYSHFANSTYGIPFDILGLQRKTLTYMEWPLLFLLAPFNAFKSPNKEKMYVVEADCDRPNEGRFLGSLLKPEVVIWLSVSKTHSINFKSLDDIAYEFGFFLKYCQKYAIINADNKLISEQVTKVSSKVEEINKKNHLQKYQILENTTKFKIDDEEYFFKILLPEETFYSIEATFLLLRYLNIKPMGSFASFALPPGRSSLFKGVKNTTIVDSSYNATPASMEATLNMYKLFFAKNKWAVISDMIELGKDEEEEHKKLANLIAATKLDKVVLMGPRVKKYTFPALRAFNPRLPVEVFLTPKEVLKYLKENIKGEETILFKGARFLEGVIEHLLKNKADIAKLCRREKIWEIRRRKWGL